MGQTVNSSVQRLIVCLLYRTPHSDFGLLALAEGNNDSGKINVLASEYFISGYRELDLVYK